MKVCNPTEQQWPRVERAISDGFAQALNDAGSELKEKLRPWSRRVALQMDDDIVGGCFAYDFKLAVPGGAQLPAAGLAGVAIAPPAQGRGGLSAMMREHFQQCRTHGDAASLLMASEGGIYSRFGYGVASEFTRWHANTRELSFERASCAGGKFRIVHARADAVPLLNQIYAACMDDQPGSVARSEDWWNAILLPTEPAWVALGEQSIIVVHYNTQNRPDGYVIYRLHEPASEAFENGRMAMTVYVKELCGADLEVELAMFEYLVRLPWCRELVWEIAPVQPAIQRLLRDARQLWQRCRVDMMWLRPIDLQQLLVCRGYDQDGEVLLDYRDAELEEQQGRWRLWVQNGTAQLTRSDDFAAPCVVLGAAELGAVYCGNTRLVDLARVGKVYGDDAQIRTLDRMLLVDSAPFNMTRF